VVRENAARALGYYGDSCAIEPLIEALKNTSPNVRSKAISAIVTIDKSKAIDIFVEISKSELEELKKELARGLGHINDFRVIRILLEALKDEDLSIIAGAHMFFIYRGEPQTENVLIHALNKYGDESMVNDFLGCGNKNLWRVAAVSNSVNIEDNQRLKVDTGKKTLLLCQPLSRLSCL
jgi:hypothetical protein